MVSDTDDIVSGENEEGRKFDLTEWLEPMEGSPANITYSDDAPIDERDVEKACLLDECTIHGDGDDACPVPDTWGELRDQVIGHPGLRIPADRRSIEPGEETYVDPTAVDLGSEMRRQPVPDASMCPYCGGEPTDESELQHHLSAMGYRHDDIRMECADCGRNWPLGVPIGEIDDEYSADLFCESCEQRYMLVHRVEPRWHAAANHGREMWDVRVHLKCPNCFYFKKIGRHCDDRGVALIGYPQITGSREGATPEGY